MSTSVPFWRLATLIAIAVATPTLGANAVLLEIDRFTEGDGLITRDTETGLDWLDPGASAGFTFSQIQDGAGFFRAVGWRHAITSEVCDLLGKIGSLAETCPGVFNGGDPQEADPYIELLGANVADSVIGIFDNESGPGRQGGAAVGLDADGASFLWVFRRQAGGRARSGHFLVRPIPEPSTATLLLSGLALTLANRRRYARRPTRRCS